MMWDLQTVVGYLSGLYFIKADFDPYTFLRTAALVHLVDAVLCCLIAAHAGRNKKIWTVAGLFLGIWALGTLFLLSEKRQEKEHKT